MLTKAEITRLRSLHLKKHREELGFYLVEGEKVIAELLQAGVQFEELYAVDGAALPRNRQGTPEVRTVSPAEMQRISHFPTPSALLAVGKLRRQPLPAGALKVGFTLALDHVQDAGNVGTLLRIADWFGFQRVLLSPHCADLFSQKVINASMGSFARVEVYTAELPEILTDAGVPVLGCDLSGDDVHTLPQIPAAVLVIGSEGRGLSEEVKPCLTRRVTIPRYGSAESLNAAVAAGIVCDNLRRNS